MLILRVGGQSGSRFLFHSPRNPNGVELTFGSETSYTRVDLSFRDRDGLVVLNDYITFDGASQMFIPLLETYLKLENFVGSMEWTVSWPGADLDENQYLTSMALLKRSGGLESFMSAMTLSADQPRVRRHESRPGELLYNFATP